MEGKAFRRFRQAAQVGNRAAVLRQHRLSRELMKRRITRINADWVGKSLSRSGGLRPAAKLGAPRQSPLICLTDVYVQPEHYFGRMKPRLSNYYRRSKIKAKSGQNQTR